jgi:hypothetical protein
LKDISIRVPNLNKWVWGPNSFFQFAVSKASPCVCVTLELRANSALKF